MIANRTRSIGVRLTVLALLVAAVVSLADGAASAQPARVAVGSTVVGPSVAPGFVGIATEFWDVEKEVGTDPAHPDPAFEQLLRNLAPYGGLTLRIGGDSTDWGWWPIPGMQQPPWVRWTMTPTWAAVTKRLVQDLHAHLIVGLNMEAGSAKIDVAELRELRLAVAGSAPVTYELGNEPELYSHFPFYHNKAGKAVLGRPKGYSYPDIATQWNQLAAALPGVALAGPGFSGTSALPYLSQFLTASPRLSLLTVHTYPLKSKRCNGGVNLQEGQLFEPSSLQQLASQIGSWVSVAGQHRVSLRVDEMNSVTCGGLPGFSGSFGPALWALNILPLYAEAGVIGVNFQTRPDTAQNLIQPQQTSAGWRVQVMPEYYGLLTFAQLTPPGSKLLRVTAAHRGLLSWAVLTPQGQEHVVVTNITGKASELAVSAAGARGPATVESLRAGTGGLRAEGGVTLAGQRISASTGALTGALQQLTVRPTGRAYHVTVAADSAAIITFKR